MSPDSALRKEYEDRKAREFRLTTRQLESLAENAGLFGLVRIESGSFKRTDRGWKWTIRVSLNGKRFVTFSDSGYLVGGFTRHMDGLDSNGLKLYKDKYA